MNFYTQLLFSKFHSDDTQYGANTFSIVFIFEKTESFTKNEYSWIVMSIRLKVKHIFVREFQSSIMF